MRPSSQLNNNRGGANYSTQAATETDPLIPSTGTASFVRERRSSKSPTTQQLHFHQHQQQGTAFRPDPPMIRIPQEPSHSGQLRHEVPHIPGNHTGTYDSADSRFNDHAPQTPSIRSQGSAIGRSSRDPRGPDVRQQFGDFRQQYYNERANRILGEGHGPTHRRQEPPLLVDESVLAVRTAALTVLSPLTHSWLIVAFGVALTVGLGMARWTGLLSSLPYWIILLPSWLGHIGLLVCHMLAGKALSIFIADANDNRQRLDSTDHIDRTEYLPLLQRSLKFGLKTGVLSLFIFVFEVLIYLREARGTVNLGMAFVPLWSIVVGGIIDGIVCKTQHLLRLLCSMLMFLSMLLAVMKIDHGLDFIQWRLVVSPIVALLSISSGTLIYIVYGHQVGYFRLTESQLTAGILYSMAALLSIVLVVIVGEVIPLVQPREEATRVFVTTLAPLVVLLVGMGAWVVTRGEFARLLQYGGQAAVHPMKLRLEPTGWTSVESKGVTIIPMFGEVR